MFQGNLRLPMILRQLIEFYQKYLPTLPNLLELNCHHILTLFTLTKRQLFSISILLSLSTASTLSETAFYIEDESVVIRPKNGFGGIGGEYIKPTALANVHAFYQRLNPQIQSSEPVAF